MYCSVNFIVLARQARTAKKAFLLGPFSGMDEVKLIMVYIQSTLVISKSK